MEDLVSEKLKVDSPVLAMQCVTCCCVVLLECCCVCVFQAEVCGEGCEECMQ